MSVFVSNLDDFINPAQACVNPLVQSKLAKSNEESNAGGDSSSSGIIKRGIISLANDYSLSEFSAANESLVPVKEPNLIRTTKSKNAGSKVATVSLNDCLACRYDRPIH